MEDTVSVTTPLDEDDDHTGLFAVFDGHAGTQNRRDAFGGMGRKGDVPLYVLCWPGAAAAEFAADRLWDTLSETVTWQTGDRSEAALRKALHDTCLGLDARLQELPRFKVSRHTTLCKASSQSEPPWD
jgi:serine/threonine protein phosphatase PrpC